MSRQRMPQVIRRNPKGCEDKTRKVSVYVVRANSVVYYSLRTVQVSRYYIYQVYIYIIQ